MSEEATQDPPDEVPEYSEFVVALGLGSGQEDLVDVVDHEPLRAIQQVTEFLRRYPDLVDNRKHGPADRLGYGLLIWGETIWRLFASDRISPEQKLSLIETMKIPFVDGLPKHPSEWLPEWLFHWWANLCECFAFEAREQIGIGHEREPGVGRKPLHLHGELRRVHDALFAAIESLLEYPDSSVQICAIHGFNHLYHPHGSARMQRYIDEQCTEEDDLEGIGLCRDGLAH